MCRFTGAHVCGRCVYLGNLVSSSSRPCLRDVLCSISSGVGHSALCRPCFNWAGFLAFLDLTENFDILRSFTFAVPSAWNALYSDIHVSFSWFHFSESLSNITLSVRSSLCNLYKIATCLTTLAQGTCFPLTLIKKNFTALITIWFNTFMYVCIYCLSPTTRMEILKCQWLCLSFAVSKAPRE